MQAGLYALLFFVACGQAVAHQQKIAITTVLFNPRTENIEIMHRFNLHDAEHAVLGRATVPSRRNVHRRPGPSAPALQRARFVYFR